MGSSARITLGSPISARAMATRCCWPPESSRGRWLGPVGEPDPLEVLPRPAVALAPRHALVVERQGDVLDRGLEGDQVEGLEDEAEELAPEHRGARLGEVLHQLAVERVLALVVVVEEPEHVEEGRLAGARGAHDRHQLAAGRCRGRCPSAHGGGWRRWNRSCGAPRSRSMGDSSPGILGEGVSLVLIIMATKARTLGRLLGNPIMDPPLYEDEGAGTLRTP